MLPIYLKVENFTSYIDEVIEFEKFGNIFTIVGNNGAGKSSIIDMITTCIFYQNRCTDSRGAGMDELINSSGDKMKLEFKFKMNNNEYLIVRKKTRGGSHELEFYINGSSQSEKITETQKKILNVLKMNYDTFLDTICIGQGQSGRFMTKKPNERKDVFVQVLGLNEYEKLEKLSKEKKKNLSLELDSYNFQINDLKNSVANKSELIKEESDLELTLSHENKSIIDLEKELENELIEKTKHEQLKIQNNHILNQRLNLEEKIKSCENNIIDIKAQINEIEPKLGLESSLISRQENLNKELNDNETEFSETKIKLTSVVTTNDMLNEEVIKIKQKYNNFKNYNHSICDFCGNSISETHKAKHLEELMLSGKSILKNINLNRVQIDDMKLIISEKSKTISSLKVELNETKTKIDKINSFKIKLENLKQNLKQYSNTLKEYSLEYEDNLKINVIEVGNKVFKDFEIKTKINRQRSLINEYQTRLAMTKSKLEMIEKDEIRLQNAIEKLDELELVKSDYESLIQAYGKSGIQADIIGNALPEIQDEINNLLNVLCNGSISIEFLTQKDSKGKKSVKSIETLDIIVNDKIESRTYESYSGGEKFRIDFACHVGLAKFLTKRAGSNMDFFIIDEGLGSQDDDARNQFIQSVNLLSTVFKQVMIITHIDEMKDAFENKVLVYKDSKLGSKISVI